jgi:hypothetical protein
VNNDVTALHKGWLKNDPAYRKAYNDLENEFKAASELIEQRHPTKSEQEFHPQMKRDLHRL